MSEPGNGQREKGQPVHGSLERTPPEPFLVVGIGASAGGIEALRTFFSQARLGSGAAYVVILHLSPDHESQLATVLQNTTQLRVMQVRERVKVVPDHVYVVPPDRHLTMEDGEIEVSHNLSREQRRAPIDIFLRTLGESHGEHAVAVILSGTGADGSSGFKRVKELGGAAFVQDPREAKFPDMPESAIATGLVDEVLPISAIPAKISAYGEALARIYIPEAPEIRSAEQERALREIFTHLRVSTGQEFSNYKRGTLMRRIERRMTVHLLRDLPTYATYLKEHPEETQALLKDLLISVTTFFRDPAAFAVLEQEVLPGILARKDAEAPVRVWVVGCATGEEAYSLAILLAERTLDVLDAPPVQIFATDLNEGALDRARAGLYAPNEIAEVPAERLRRFFTKEGENYRVHRELRRMVLFAKHDVLRNPPFSRLDLATCRNLLIYLNAPAQERVLRTLHFALNPGGALFLGASESIDSSSELFAPIDREARLYRSHEVGPRHLPSPEAIPDLRIEVAPILPARPEPL